MATTAGAIRLLRQARRRQAPTRAAAFPEYEPEYRRILTALRRATDEPTMDRLLEWAVEHVEATGTLPTPAELRTRARELCEERGVPVPAGLRR